MQGVKYFNTILTMTEKNNIPLLRFPEFDCEWKIKKLGEIALFSKGKGISKSDIVENGENECIRYGELYTRYKEVIREVFSRTNIDKKDLILSEINDVIIPSSGETEIDIATASCIQKSGIALGGDLNIIKTKNDGIFLSYYLNNKKRTNIASLAQGKSIVHLYADQLAKLDLSLPSLPEQEKIAAFFTAVDEKISGLKKKKKLLEQYKKGLMQKIFSRELRFKDDNGHDFPDWEEKKLGEVTQIFDGTHQTPHYVESGIPFYSVEQITANDFTHTKYISSEVFEKESRIKIEKNDILMTRIGDIGTSRLINWEVKASFYVSLALIKQSNYFISKYLNHYISTKQFQQELWNRTIHVAFPRKINLTEIGYCIVELPNINEQTKIANFLSSIDEKIENCQKQIESSEQWKKGLLQRMFC